MALIRDLSRYDTAPVPYQDYDGLIPRCYDGTDPDPLFEKHKAGAKAASKPWWPYAFYDFLYPALPQVQEVYAITRADPGVLPVAFDVEEWKDSQGVFHPFPARNVLLSNLFVLYDNYGTLTNKICQFYMNPAAIHHLEPIPSWLLSCPLWLANWGVAVPDFEPWSHYTFWQYHGEPDWNRFNGTDAEYLAYVGGTPVPPLPAPSLPSVVRIAASGLNVRSTPMGTIVGQVKQGWLLGVNGESTYNGVKWWRIGNAYISSEWCEIVNA